MPPRSGTTLLERVLGQLAPDWELSGDRLRKTFRFPDFASALAFVDRVGALAEREQHHPDIQLGWGRATLEIWTHAIAGLSENDFILAAKVDQLPTG